MTLIRSAVCPWLGLWVVSVEAGYSPAALVRGTVRFACLFLLCGRRFLDRKSCRWEFCLHQPWPFRWDRRVTQTDGIFLRMVVTDTLLSSRKSRKEMGVFLAAAE